MRHNVIFAEGKYLYFSCVTTRTLELVPPISGPVFYHFFHLNILRQLIYDVCISVTKFVAHYWSRLAG